MNIKRPSVSFELGQFYSNLNRGLCRLRSAPMFARFVRAHFAFCMLFVICVCPCVCVCVLAYARNSYYGSPD